jgi:hypothetical protein
MRTKTSQSPKAAIGASPRKRQNQMPQSDEPQLAPETADLLAKLEGDEETVMSALRAALQTDVMLGFYALSVACRVVKDVELRKYLIETLGCMGRYPDLRRHVVMTLMDLAGRETSLDVFLAIDQAWESFEGSPHDMVSALGIEVPPELEDSLLTREDLGLPTTSLSSGSNMQHPVDRGPCSEGDRVAAAVGQTKGKPSVFDRWRNKQSEPETSTNARPGRRSKTSKKSAATTHSAMPKSDDTPASDPHAGALQANGEPRQPEQIRVGSPKDN